MTRTRPTSLGAIGDRSAPPGSRDWAISVRLDLQACIHSWDQDVKHVRRYLDLMIKHEGWRNLETRDGLRYESFEQFCKDREPFGLGVDPSIYDAIRNAAPGTKVKAVLKKVGAPVGSKNNAAPWGPASADKDSESNVDNVKIKHSVEPSTSGGNSTRYIQARLDRDRPDLLAKVVAGELSAHAAAVEAGFRKRRTPLDDLRIAWRKASADERAQFLNEVEHADQR